MKTTTNLITQTKLASNKVLKYILFLILTSCSMLSQPIKLNLSKIRFNIKKNANDSNGIMVHLLIFYDEELMKAVGGWSSKEYFKKRKHFKNQYQGKVKVIQWTMASQKQMTIEETVDFDSTYSKISGGIMFASYVSKGNHCIHVPEHAKSAIVHLNSKNFNIEVVS